MLRLAVLVLFGLYLVFARAQDLSIITLKHRNAQDIVSAIAPLVGPQGSVSGVDNHLLVRTSPDRLQAVQQAVALMDVERRMLRITLSRDRQSDATRRVIEAGGTVQSGDVTLRLPSGRRGATGAEVYVDRGTRRQSESGQEFISVMEGGRAVIAVGESVPYTDTWVVLTRRYASVQQTVQFQDVTTGFSVTPRILGDQVELEIVPRIAELRRGGIIEFEQLATTVSVRPGEWLDLGAVMRGRDEVSSQILSQRASSEAMRSALRVRVDLP